MARQWTPMQKQAITARGGNLLVSAAAGSGKTAVLVERVIRRMTDPVSPVPADRFLIVTFTRAAASEIRVRIAEALEDALRMSPGSEWLAKQQMLLPYAKICTIDAFCASLVKEHFASLSLSPSFQTADEGELHLLREEALSKTLEACYEKGNPDFLHLVELIFQGRDDKALEEAILALYDASVAFPFPALWLKKVKNAYAPQESVCQSPFGSLVMKQIGAALSYGKSILSTIYSALFFDELLTDLFYEVAESDASALHAVQAAYETNDWDGMIRMLHAYAPMRRPNAPRGMGDDPSIKWLAALRDEFKDLLMKKIPSLLASSETEFREDMAAFAPLVAALSDAVQLFSETYRALKEEKQLADFNDIMHHALSLLVTADEAGNISFTPLSRTLREQFEEILIDEYQDTNRAQDMLFEAISKGNLFRVGDVKQSIYRFRQAMPEIFMRLKREYAVYDEENPAFPAKVILGHNFRSRESVTGAVNFVFSQIMSEETGEVEYNEEEYLVPAASYPPIEDDRCELHMLDLAELDKDLDNSDEYQAAYVAKRIRAMMDAGFCVTEKGVTRKARWQDFCILLRSINGGRGVIYAEALRKEGIPCYTEIAADFFASGEISLMLNLLRVIDNPKQDVALLSVMMSVLFGFTVDDAAALRLENESDDLYTCLLQAASRGDEKANAFLSKIAAWRSVAVSMRLGDLLRQIYDETAIVSAVSAMRDAPEKKLNLLLLLDYAELYERNGERGLSGFIRFIDRLERSGKDLAGAAGISSDADVVRVMSIHKSKGLEFPVCILGNCATAFNRTEEVHNLILHPRLGVGLKMRNSETLSQVPTVCHRAVQTALKNDRISEEMRVLYVAMTRARERLILVCAVKDLEKTMEKYRKRVNVYSNQIAPFAASLAASYADWLLPALLRHPDALPLREAGNMRQDIVLPASFSLEIFTHRWQPREQAGEQAIAPQPIDPVFLRELEERLRWEYPYLPLTRLVSKRAASEVDRNFVDRDYFASSQPAFLERGGLSAAQRGTATHTFMQYADYENAKRDPDAEIARLQSLGFITAQEAAAINRAQIRRFFESNLAKRILQSELVMREKKFTVFVPVTELYEGVEAFAEERVMIQGIADCAFLENEKLVVVDYKTDRLSSPEQFTEKYANQVRVYRRALEQCTGYQVRETLLYSFHLSKEIAVDRV